MTDRRELSDLLDALFGPSDIREMFSGGFWWLLDREKYVRFYGGPTDVTANPIFSQSKDIAIRELSIVLVGTESTSSPTEIPDATRDALRRAIKRLTIGIASKALKDIYYPLALGVLSAIDVAFDGPIRATLVPEGPHRLIDLERALVVTKPVAAFGHVRNAKEYPPPAVIRTSYLLIDQYLTHITVPPLTVDPTPLKPALFAPGSMQPVHDIPARVRVGLVSILSDATDVAWNIEEDGKFWAETTARDRQALIKKRLSWALTQASTLKTSILVIPELNLDKDLEQFLREEWAKIRAGRTPLLLVGGLLHRPSDAAPKRFRNQPIFLTEDGNLPWPYWKREGTRWPFPEGDRNEALADDCTHLASLDTALGRLCIVICRDFTLDTTFRAIAATRSNLVIVPAMTTPASVALFTGKARDLADVNHAFTIFCNSSIHVRSPKEKNPRLLGFVHANTRLSVRRLASHRLPSPDAVAVLGIYTLRFRPGTAPTSKPLILWTHDTEVTHKGYGRKDAPPPTQ